MHNFNKNGRLGAIALSLMLLCAICFAQDIPATAILDAITAATVPAEAAEATTVATNAEKARAEANEAVKAAADAAAEAAKARANANEKAAIAKKKPKVKAVVKAKTDAEEAAKAAEAKAEAAAKNAADAETAAKLAEDEAERAAADERAKAAEAKAVADAVAMAEAEAAAKAAMEIKPVDNKPVGKPTYVYKAYEDYLDSLVVYARAVQPMKEKFETQKALINEEAPKPKDNYEKQAEYDKRIANFDKDKQKRIAALEKEYNAEAKNQKNKLASAINHKDLQPDWGGILQQDTTVEGYTDRIGRLASKLSYMKSRTEQVQETLSRLDLLDKGDLETLGNNNRVYLARLERAGLLMQNYIMMEYAKILSTERQKFNMAFGAYDPEKEYFPVNMNNANSDTVPFDFVGFVKIAPAEARVIDGKTDDFLASVSYINFPFVVNGSNSYPGVAKAEIYYKDKPVSSTGNFKSIPRLEVLDGFKEWSIVADSLISGKLVPKKLDSAYVMKRELPKAVKAKEPSEGTWWSRNKNIMRATFIVLAAAGAGVGFWQNMEADNRAKDAEKFGKAAYNHGADGNKGAYDQYNNAYNDEVKKVHKHENFRNGFYIGAGVFGAVAILSFTF